MVAQRAADNLAAVAFCALVGGQDELVFDGALVRRATTTATSSRARRSSPSTCCSATSTRRRRRRRACATRASARRRARRGATCRRSAQLRLGAPTTRPRAPRSAARSPSLLDPDAEVYAALVLAHARLRRRKNGFEHVVIGLSGGIDSTLVAADRRRRARRRPRDVRDDALALLVGGHAGRTPRRSRPTSASSCSSCRSQGRWAPTTSCSPTPFAGREPDLTEENLQARIRGNLLMALSNKFGWLVLTTGNKSEMSVGYSTLYGDSAGGFAVIKDVPEAARLPARRRARRGATRRRVRRARVDRHARAVGGAAPRPARRRLAAALRGPRPRSSRATSSRTSAASS